MAWSIHETGSNQCGSPAFPNMAGFTSGLLCTLSSSWTRFSSLSGCSVICANSSGVKYFFSDHNLITLFNGSDCASGAERIVLTSAGRNCSAAEGICDFVERNVVVEWKSTSFRTYRRDKRCLKVGNVAERAERNRTAA